MALKRAQRIKESVRGLRGTRDVGRGKPDYMCVLLLFVQGVKAFR